LSSNDIATKPQYQQYGFRKHQSTVLQLLRVLDAWTDLLDQGKGLDSVYLDFRKAFDTVPLRRLQIKLQGYGIQGALLHWITDFLSNRKQKVSVNGSSSGWMDVTSGISQGSVLGPILFIIYINDLPDAIQNVAFLFADDTKMFSGISGGEDHNTLQQDLNRLTSWSATWQLQFNIDKCKVVHYGRNNPQYPYKMVSHLGEELDLASSKEEKDLGVIFDPTLKFSIHVAAVCKKGNQMVGIVRRSFKYLDKKMFLNLYKSLIRPRLEYANAVWSPLLKSDITQLEKVQRRATTLLRELKDLPYEQRLQALELPSLVYRRLRGDMIQTFKILHGYEDIDPSCLFQMSTNRQTRGHNMKIEKQRSNTKLRQNFFSMRVVNSWNSLTAEVVIAPSINSFKGRLDKLWQHHPCKYDPQ
jgi:ribonuclease P/MRP protein subunit RPP40